MILDSNTATLDQLREWMGEVIRNNPRSGMFWDLITALRGPDTPSEIAGMSQTAYQKAYDARRRRKRQTVEVIRGKAFFGAVGGSARSRDDINYVTLPPQNEWDHFDKHVERAAAVLGLAIKYLKPKKQRKKEAGEPEWETLIEGKAIGVPVKKEKKSLGSIDWPISAPPYPASFIITNQATKPETWAKTPENFKKIEETLAIYPSLETIGAMVSMDGEIWNVTKAELIEAKKQVAEQALIDTVKEANALDPNDIPF